MNSRYTKKMLSACKNHVKIVLILRRWRRKNAKWNKNGRSHVWKREWVRGSESIMVSSYVYTALAQCDTSSKMVTERSENSQINFIFKVELEKFPTANLNSLALKCCSHAEHDAHDKLVNVPEVSLLPSKTIFFDSWACHLIFKGSKRRGKLSRTEKVTRKISWNQLRLASSLTLKGNSIMSWVHL